MFSPHSPEGPPPDFETDKRFSPHSPEEGYDTFLAEQARQYNIGDQVYYRGDTVPGRLWKITYIGDRFLKIERPPDKTSDNNILMVTALDVYSPGDFVHSSPMAESIAFRGGDPNAFTNPNALAGPNAFANPNAFMGSNDFTNPNPAINFAPIFKIMNGGNDFSSEPNLTDGANVMNNVLGIPEFKVKESGEAVKTMDELPAKMDFSKLIIKKSP
jgi:hypothetical protein